MTDPTAVYRFYDAEGGLLYVGATHAPQARWKQHASTKSWWPDVARKTIRWYQTKHAARAAEIEAIETELPQHNIVHRCSMAISPAEFREIGAELKENRAALAACLAEAREVAIDAHAAGISVRRIAELLRVDRMTVRKWLERQAA